ncbi:MAG: hypothetical protein SFU91_03320 [Chloroherpetonaceae bacterium]|nr:hypothetical protein [Chloroherpetonaceae bacterium]
MSISSLFSQTLGLTFRVLHKINRAKLTQTAELQEVAIPEKLINLLLQAGIERNSPIEQPHLAIHDGFFEVKFFLVPSRIREENGKEKPKLTNQNKPLFCVLPLHFDHIVYDAHRAEAVITRFGKVTLAPSTFFQHFSNVFYQAYLNSRFGESKLLRALAEGIAGVSYLPAFRLCGNELRPASLRLDLHRILESQSVSNALIASGIRGLVGISSLKEEEGQAVLTLILGSKFDNEMAQSSSYQGFYLSHE